MVRKTAVRREKEGEETLASRGKKGRGEAWSSCCAHERRVPVLLKYPLLGIHEHETGRVACMRSRK